MSADDALLIFLDGNDGFEGWLRLRDGAVVGRGAELEGLPDLVDAETGAAVRVAAAVPGDAVTVHWLEVPAGLAPAQAGAAARLMAAEVSAQPVSDMHVAVGPEAEGDLLRAVALVPALTMAGWIGRLQARGLDPDVVIPEPLLLQPPAEGLVRHDRGSIPLYRGPTEAFSVEPGLAEIIIGKAPVETIDAGRFEAGLAAAVAAPPVDLRQGAFAKRRRWAIEWPWVRRMAMLGAAILLVTLAIQIAAILRYTYAADALEAETAAVAAAALPGLGQVSDPSAALERRLSELGGGGAGYSALAAAMFGAVQATPNVQLTAMTFDRDGSLRATVQGDMPATFSSLEQRIEAAGFEAELGAIRSGGGQPTAEMTVRTR